MSLIEVYVIDTKSKSHTNIIQEVMIAVRTKSSTYDNTKSSVSTCIYTIAKNKRIDKIRKQMRKDKVGTITNFGYDELFIIPRKNLKIEDGEADIKPEMTAAKMKAEFSKTLKTKKISRVLLNKFVERVA